LIWWGGEEAFDYKSMCADEKVVGNTRATETLRAVRWAGMIQSDSKERKRNMLWYKELGEASLQTIAEVLAHMVHLLYWKIPPSFSK